MKTATAYALVCIGMSAAISVGIIVTGSLMPLWAFIFMPSMKD